MTTTPTGSAAGTVKLAGNDGDIQEPIVNHDEAYELACLKRTDSNLARCYLALAAERDACSTLVGQRDKEIEALAEDVRATAREKAALAAERDALKARVKELEDAERNDAEHVHAMQHLADYGNNDMARIDAENKLTAAQSSEERLKQVLRKVQIELRGVGPESSREFHRIGIESALGMLKAALSTHPSAREQGESHD